MRLNETGKTLRDAVNKAHEDNLRLTLDPIIIVDTHGVVASEETARIAALQAELLASAKPLYDLVNSDWLYENFPSSP